MTTAAQARRARKRERKQAGQTVREEVRATGLTLYTRQEMHAREARWRLVVLNVRGNIVEQALAAARIPVTYGLWLGEQAALMTVQRIAMIQAGVEPPPLNRPWLGPRIWLPE